MGATQHKVEAATRGVLFDLDGTLCDRDAAWHSYLAAQHANFCEPEVNVETYRRRALALEQQFRSDRARVFRILAQEFSIEAAPDELLSHFRAHIAQHSTLLPGARELLESLRARNLLIALVTNGSVRAQESKIAALGLAPLMDAILISEREGVRKPDPLLFERAVQRLGLMPSECIFVGDDPYADIVGAQNANLKTIWLGDAATWPPELAHLPDAVASSLHDVAERIY